MRRPRFQPYIYLAFSLFIVLIFYDAFSRAYFWLTGYELAKKAIPYEQVISTSTERILMIGDSTVVGTGASDPLKSIAGQFGTECKNWEIINEGKNGDRTIHLAERINIGSKERFDLAIVQIGGNDVLHASPLDQVKEDINLTLEKIKTISRHVLLVSTSAVEIAPFFPWYVEDIYTERSREVSQILQDTAIRQGVLFVNSGEVTSDVAQENFWAVDRFHPSDSGYGVWYELVRTRLEQAGVLERNARGIDGHCIIH